MQAVALELEAYKNFVANSRRKPERVQRQLHAEDVKRRMESPLNEIVSVCLAF